MYDVVFTSVLSVMDNVETKRFQIVSKGTAIRVTPRFPETRPGSISRITFRSITL